MIPAVVAAAVELASFVPGLIKAFGGGDKSASVAEKVVGIAKAVTGKDEPNEALYAIKADPQLAYQFQTAVLNAKTAGELAEWKDEADRRADIRESGELSRQVRPAIALSFHAAVLGMALFGPISDLKSFLTIELATFGGVNVTMGGAYVMIVAFYFLTKGMKDYFISKNPLSGRESS